TATELHAIEVEDTAVAILEFESGALATLEATTAAFPGYPRRLELTGTHGTVALEDDRLVAIDLQNDAVAGSGAPGQPPDAQPTASPRAASAVVADVSGHRAVFEDFLRAIAENRRPCCDGVDGRRSVALVQAIYAAARSGAVVVPQPA